MEVLPVGTMPVSAATYSNQLMLHWTPINSVATGKKLSIKVVEKHLIFPLLQVYDGTQTWDTAFIVKAYCSADLIHEFAPTLSKAHEFIKCLQVVVTYIFYTHIW
jgi:hypothetical protein